MDVEVMGMVRLNNEGMKNKEKVIEKIKKELNSKDIRRLNDKEDEYEFTGVISLENNNDWAVLCGICNERLEKLFQELGEYLETWDTTI